MMGNVLDRIPGGVHDWVGPKRVQEEAQWGAPGTAKIPGCAQEAQFGGWQGAHHSCQGAYNKM
jgi:hypothetical protein